MTRRSSSSSNKSKIIRSTSILSRGDALEGFERLQTESSMIEEVFCERNSGALSKNKSFLLAETLPDCATNRDFLRFEKVVAGFTADANSDIGLCFANIVC